MLTILDRGQAQYLWFRLQEEPQGRGFFRVVALLELASVPVSIREDFDLLEKQWAAVRGLYNARADFIYSAAGIFTPEHVGVVQYYGGAGLGRSQEEAAQVALHNLAAVQATLANYEPGRTHLIFTRQKPAVWLIIPGHSTWEEKPWKTKFCQRSKTTLAT